MLGIHKNYNHSTPLSDPSNIIATWDHREVTLDLVRLSIAYTSRIDLALKW